MRDKLRKHDKNKVKEATIAMGKEGGERKEKGENFRLVGFCPISTLTHIFHS